MQARFIAPQTTPAMVTCSSRPGASPQFGVDAICTSRDGSGVNANAQAAAAAQTPPDAMTAGHPNEPAMTAWIGRASMAPNGQLICRIDIARTISRLSNQSVTIFVATNTTIVAPTPPINRATNAT